MSLQEKQAAIYDLYEHTKNKLGRLGVVIPLERKDGLSEGDTAHKLTQRILLQHLEGTIVWKLERGRKAEHFMLVCKNQIEVTIQKRKKLMKLAKRAKRDPPLVKKVLMNNYAAYCLGEGKKVAYEEFVVGDLLRAVTDAVDEEDDDDDDNEDVKCVGDNDEQQHEQHHDVPSDKRITKETWTVNEANGDEEEENLVEREDANIDDEEEDDVDDEGNYILDEEEIYDVDDEEDCYEFNDENDNADEVDDDYFDDEEDYILEDGEYHDADNFENNDDHEDDGNDEENDDEDEEENDDAVAHDDDNNDDGDDDGDDIEI